MSIGPNHVAKFRVNRITMPYGSDSFFTFSLNHEGLTRLMAICFNPEELFDIDSVDVMMKKIFSVWDDMTKQMDMMEIADAQARSDDPQMRDKIPGLHLGRDPSGELYFTPAYLHHAKECGWQTTKETGTQ